MKEAGQAKALDKQRKVIEVLKRNNLDVKLWEALLIVSAHEGLSLQDLVPYTTMPKSTLGRFLQLLSMETLPQRRVREALGDGQEDESSMPKLLEARLDVGDYRRKGMYLTTEGRKVLSLINSILEA